MTNVNIILHQFQKEILKKLALAKSARFNDLLIEGLESEHMNYHLQRLMEFGLVAKEQEKYSLTDQGKDYSNLLDDDVEIIEKQPKTSVLLQVMRKNKQTDEVEHLLSKRLRQPYFGKSGRLTGKVRFGESLEQAAARELYEETGLKASKIILQEVYHKLRHRADDTWIQDVLFYRFLMLEVSGAFIAKTAYQENQWVSKKQVETSKEIDVFDDLVLDDDMEVHPLVFRESIAEASGF